MSPQPPARSLLVWRAKTTSCDIYGIESRRLSRTSSSRCTSGPANAGATAGPVPSSTIVAENADVQAFQYEMAMEARGRPELLATNQAVYEQYRQATRRELVRMGLADDPALAHAVFAMLDGLVFQKVLFGKPVEPAIEWLRTMLKALQATEAAPTKRGPRRRRVESADTVEGEPAI
jgi:hypothetical protein